MPIMPSSRRCATPGCARALDRAHEGDREGHGGLKDSFTLTKLKELNLDETPQSLEAVTKVCDVAGKEYAIEQVARPPHTWHRTPRSPTSHPATPPSDRAQALDKMEAEWKGVNLEIVAYRETGTYVLKGFDVVQQLLDDHIVMTQSMSFSPFKGPFAQRIDDWERLLTLMSEIFEEWVKCQRAWMYLEPIFSSDDIMRQLPTEGKRFAGVDGRGGRRSTRRTTTPTPSPSARRRASSTTSRRATRCSRWSQKGDEDGSPVTRPRIPASPHIPPALQVQKGLAEYLETKRASFARFYFLSNDDAEILPQTKDPLAVQVTGRRPPPTASTTTTSTSHLAHHSLPPRAAPPQEVLREHGEGEARGRSRDERDDLGRGRDRPLQGATRRLRQHHHHHISSPPLSPPPPPSQGTVKPVGSVEFWMSELLEMMKKTARHVTLEHRGAVPSAHSSPPSAPPPPQVREVIIDSADYRATERAGGCSSGRARARSR